MAAMPANMHVEEGLMGYGKALTLGMVSSDPRPILLLRGGVVVFLNAAAAAAFGPRWAGQPLSGLFEMPPESAPPKSLCPAIPCLIRAMRSVSLGIEVDGLYCAAQNGGLPGCDGVLIITAMGPLLKARGGISTQQLGEICHDMRTPVQMMLGTLQLLRTRILSGEEGRGGGTDAYLDTLSENGYRLLRMVNNLVDQARLEADSMQLSLCQGELVGMIKELLRCARPYADYKGVCLSFITAQEAVPCAYDEEKMERVLLNLLSNALKYTPAGGQITVTLDCYGGCAHICVADTGVGIPRDRIDSIFSRYTTSEADCGLGSGIGLALVKALLQLHGGQVEVDSVEGEGTEFSFTLPLTQMVGEGASCLLNSTQERVRVELADVNRPKAV